MREHRRLRPIDRRFWGRSEIRKVRPGTGYGLRRKENSPENYRHRIRTAWRARVGVHLGFLANCCQHGSGVQVAGDGGGDVQTRRCLAGVVPMEYGLVWLQNGEYDRSHASDEKLRNNDEDVVYTL
jgi:hypothetical protein